MYLTWAVDHAASEPPAECANYGLVFAEEFNASSLDKLQFRINSGGDEFAADAFSLQTIDGNRCLVITSYSTYDNNGKWLENYGGIGHFISKGTQERFWTYGYFEAKIKFTSEADNNPAFWLTTWYKPGQPAARGNDVNILEYGAWGGWDNHILSSIYAGGPKCTGTAGVDTWDHRRSAAQIGITDVQKNWHTYGLLWTPTGYACYVDGKKAWTENDPKAISHGPQFVVLDAAPDNHCEGPDYPHPEKTHDYGPRAATATKPASRTKMIVDYFRLYQASGDGPAGNMYWRKGFGGSDQAHWGPDQMTWSNNDDSAKYAKIGDTLSEQWVDPVDGSRFKYAGSNAIFKGDGRGAVCILNNYVPKARSLEFRESNFTITGSSLTMLAGSISCAPGLIQTINSSIGGTAGVILLGGGRLVLGGNNTYGGPTIIKSGTLELRGTAAQDRVLHGDGCDIQEGKIVFHHLPPTTTLKALAASYHAGAWDAGPFRCTTHGQLRGLGWIADGQNSVVAPAWYGDANLDGVVDDADEYILRSNFGGNGKVWSQGDFNYDGLVNAADLAILQRVRNTVFRNRN
jgi:autotransporter-associated beta strand protein